MLKQVTDHPFGQGELGFAGETLGAVFGDVAGQ